MIVFADATVVVVQGLDAGLADPVLPRVPNPRPAAFYTVRRVGGPRRNIVTDSPTITVESWGGSDEDAADMAQLARAVLHDLLGTVVDGVLVCKVDEFSGPVNLPDPLSDQPRYTQTFSVALRAT
jgi:hypothetical protein